jgi:hypothetical protein
MGRGANRIPGAVALPRVRYASDWCGFSAAGRRELR